MTLFSNSPDRRNSNSIKWTLFEKDVLPLWVADMDFPAPQPILTAIQNMLNHGVLGYEFPSAALYQTVAERMERIHGWQVDPEWVLAVPGVISGFHAAAHAYSASGGGVLLQTPAYPPFFYLAKNLGLINQLAPLRPTYDGQEIKYEIDWQVFEKAIHSNNTKTDIFLLCNPHNPTGRMFSRDELIKMAEICLEKNVILCADEIHNEHILDDTQHTVLASISPEIANQTITLVAPSKTFNIPGLFCAFAIIPNPVLREQYLKATERMVSHVSSLSLAAAQAAFGGDCDGWLKDLRLHLIDNRNLLINTLKTDFPEIRYTRPQSTYMTWLDCSPLIKSGQMKGLPHPFFLEKARVGLPVGSDFGEEYQNYTRLLFGCTHQTLIEGLSRMKAALD